MYDFFMVGWELDYSRNRVMVDETKMKFKKIEIKKENLLKRDIKTFIRLLLALINYQTNVVYVPAFNQVNVPIIILLSKLFRKKLIIDILVSEYDTIVKDRKLVSENSWKAKRAYFLDKICLKYADTLICDTYLHKKYFVDYFNGNPDKIIVIPVGAEKHFYDTNYHDENNEINKFKAVFYGGFSPLHGIDIIVKAAHILKNDTDISFTLVGTGQTKKEIVEMVRKLNINNVEFIDKVEYEKLPSFLGNYEVGLGIFGETEKANRVVPNKVYQMAACKKAIITKETPGIKEVFSNNRNIILLSNQLSLDKELAKKVLELKQDNTNRIKIANNSYKLMNEKYSYINIRNYFNMAIKNLSIGKHQK